MKHLLVFLFLSVYCVSAIAEQCVPYARVRSGIQISGDAHEWWGKAQSKGKKPHAGSVMSMPKQGGGPLGLYGHVAVVADVISSTEITIDHANWDGQETRHLGSKVRDVSGNWTRVQIEISPGAGYGATVYDVNGFIYPQGMTETDPNCNISSWRCSTRINGPIAWFPPVDDCQRASQWFRVTKNAGGEVISWQTTTRSACPLVCYAN